MVLGQVAKRRRPVEGTGVPDSCDATTCTTASALKRRRIGRRRFATLVIDGRSPGAEAPGWRGVAAVGGLRWRSSFAIRRSPFAVRRSPFVDRRSSFAIRRSPFAVRRSSFVVRRSSFVVRRSPSRSRAPMARPEGSPGQRPGFRVVNQPRAESPIEPRSIPARSMIQSGLQPSCILCHRNPRALPWAVLTSRRWRSRNEIIREKHLRRTTFPQRRRRSHNGPTHFVREPPTAATPR